MTNLTEWTFFARGREGVVYLKKGKFEAQGRIKRLLRFFK